VFIGLAAPSAALAQDAAAPKPAPAPENVQSAPEASEIIVTGTRVVRDGYQAPTPVSVIGAEDIAARAPANIAGFVNTLPSLANSQTPTVNIGHISDGLSGINTLNLRSLNSSAGGTRTLVLLDGQRVGPSALVGVVDINQFPEQLIKRVDVVTGGASADWGSDALAGVVNFVLDKDFTGIKGEVQGGVTTYGDDRNYKVNLTLGTKFAGGRGHILLAGQVAYNDGISGVPRPWANVGNEKLLFSNPAYAAGNGQPQFLVRNNAGFATVTPGGIITAGPLRGTYFGPGGTPAAYNYGPIVSGNFMQGGQVTSDLQNAGDLDPRLSRKNVFFRASYDLTDHFHIFGQASYGDATSRLNFGYQYKFANVTVSAANPFIPASTAAAIAAYNANPANAATPITSLTMGTYNQDLGGAIISTRRKNWRFVGGLSGDFEALGSNWNWDAYAQKTITDIHTQADLLKNVAYAAAINAVRNPTTGNIECAALATNPGCVPYNVFGTGVNSAAAVNYVTGSAFLNQRLRQDVQAINLRGNPFSTWAGPVSVAMGFEHRVESTSGVSDALNEAALATSKANGTPIVNQYFAGNYHPTRGGYNVAEGYFETVVPLAKDLPFAKSLDLNAGVRATNYSTSGYVTTWKAGLTWSPIEDITFRATRSHDIRAPNLAELFQNSLTSTTVVNLPANSTLNPTASAKSQTLFSSVSGSTALKPEVSNTTGFGVVLKPRFLPGFGASVDYYDIRISNAIITPTGQQQVDQCNAGVAASCQQVNLTAGTIAITPVNFAKQIARGIDFEASYRQRVELSPSLSGNLSLRVLATRFLKNYIDTGISTVAPIDNVGDNSVYGGAPPKWKYSATLIWDGGPLTASFTMRGISAGVYNKNYIECASACPTATAAHPTIENNRIAGAQYFDTSFTYKLPYGIQAYVAVDNLLNKAPVMVAYGPTIGQAPISINPNDYDVLGRVFRFGIRFKM